MAHGPVAVKMERKQKEFNELNGKITRLEAEITRREIELREKNTDLDGINEKRKTLNIYLTKLQELEQELKLLEGNKILKRII